MRHKLIVAGIALLFTTSPLVAQAEKDAKAETSCNTTASERAQSGANNTGTSMAVEKSAILPSAGGHANSAAPTVQSDGKAMEVKPNCPPETRK